MSYSIGELSKMTGVSIRMLRHYDAIGLLSPVTRTVAGYRRYGEDEVERLQRIVAYRELGFDLARIKRILDNSAEGVVDELRHQRVSLREQVERLEEMLRGIDSMIEEPREQPVDRKADAEGVLQSTTAEVRIRDRMWIRTLQLGVAAFALGVVTRFARPFFSGRVNWESLVGLMIVLGAIAVIAWRPSKVRPRVNFQLKNLLIWGGFACGWSVVHGYFWEDLVGVIVAYGLGTAIVGHIITALRVRYGPNRPRPAGGRDEMVAGEPSLWARMHRWWTSRRSRGRHSQSELEFQGS